MADEIQIITTSADGSSWADLIPGAVSSGYQAQNTNIDASRNGMDKSSISYDFDTSEIVIAPSGVIDVNGLPFAVASEVRLAISSNGDYYIKLVAGTGSTLRSAELTASKGTWDASKNAFYDSGNRILNWLISKTNDGVKMFRLVSADKNSGSDIRPDYPWGYVRRADLPEWMFWYNVTDSFAVPSVPSSVTVDQESGNMLIGNLSFGRSVTVHDGISATIIDTIATPSSAIPAGIAVDPSTGNLIIGASSTIYIMDGITDSLLTSFASPAAGLTGLCVDSSSGNLISTNSTTNLIYIHSGITSSVLSSFATPGSDCRGAAYDKINENLLSVDAGTDKIYIHDLITATIIEEVKMSIYYSGSLSVPGDIAYYNGATITTDTNNDVALVRGYL